jgi:hypothetical protein
VSPLCNAFQISAHCLYLTFLCTTATSYGSYSVTSKEVLAVPSHSLSYSPVFLPGCTQSFLIIFSCFPPSTKHHLKFSWQFTFSLLEQLYFEIILDFQKSYKGTCGNSLFNYHLSWAPWVVPVSEHRVSMAPARHFSHKIILKNLPLQAQVWRKTHHFEASFYIILYMVNT